MTDIASSAAAGSAAPRLRPDRSFQDLILALQVFWAGQGCAVLQPYDMEVGAGTFHPATTLRALGPNPWRAAYVQPSRRPKDGRYGENPNRLQHYYQFQVILKPNPPNLQELYLASLDAIGIDTSIHDVRFVEDDWESPTLGAWGLGWECWCDGMEVSQFTYFQQVAGVECAPVSGELTYGLERLAMYVQGVENVYDLNFNGREGAERLSYGDVFLQAEREYSRHNFEGADTAMLFEQFRMAEGACGRYLEENWIGAGEARRHAMALPAYDQCIKASHVFNLLDARGVISVTERQSYILRVRELAKACGQAWLATEAGGAPVPGGASAPAGAAAPAGASTPAGAAAPQGGIGVNPGATRNIHVSITRVAYDLVLTATNDTGVAKLAGVGATAETGEEIGDVDLTFWGSTPAQLKMRARAWPERFDRVDGDYFGVSSAGEHRFDIFLNGERFFRLLDLAHGSRRAIVRLRCAVSADGLYDLVHEVEISAGRG